MTRQANRLQDGLIVENGNITLSTSSDIVRDGVSVLGGGGSALANYEEDSTTYSTLGVGNQLEYGGYVWVNSDGGRGMFGGTTVRAIADDIGNNFYISYSDEGLAAGIPDSGNYYHWKFNGNDNTLEMPSGGAFRPDGSTTTNQVLKIVPTNNERGDHIHLVSGNIGITSIFLGDDTQYIRTQADGAMVIGTADAYPDEVNTNSNRWIFNTDGSTTFPNDTILGTGSDPNVYIQTLANGSTSTWTFAAGGALTLPGSINNSTKTTTGSGDPAYPIAIDLTKAVNKLADNTGSTYTLADGVEGQIMYLVPQTGATMTGVNVTVNHARILDNSTSTALVVIDALLAPFNPVSTPLPTMGVTTLIFTDGAWQADTGFWDY